MTNRVEQFGEIPVYLATSDGPIVSTADDALDIIGDLFGQQTRLVVLPISRLDDTFFDLSTRLAGEYLQKFVNYHIRLCIVGDISTYRANSSALDAFVIESNRGNHIWFLPTLEALQEKLQS